jgi:hypothetical protein
MPNVWLVIEEQETGYNAAMQSYLVHAAYRSERAAEEAKERLRTEHHFNDPDDDWCTCHGVGFSLDEVPLLWRPSKDR